MNCSMRFPTLLALALCAGPAHAVDGVLEINQTCAELTCFPGDVLGFPVEITSSAPGNSFRLTSDLVIPDTNPGGIHIDGVEDTSIDLNGFSIIRAACVATPDISCTPASGSGHGIGIAGNSSDTYGHSVKNGSVVGMSGDGVKTGTNSEVVNVRTRWNSFSGIAAGNGSTISGCTAYQNGSGISALDGSTVRDNSVLENVIQGIFARDGTTVSGNSVVNNGGTGIFGGLGGLVERNTVLGNTSTGLNLNADTGYRGNVVSGNGATVLQGVSLGANSCNGTTTCP